MSAGRLVAKRRIAAARNGGARVAEGRILCFVDADTPDPAIHGAIAAATLDPLLS